MSEHIPISVVIPTYNRTTVLFNTIRCVLAGKQLPDEIVVVDQSTPATVFPEDLMELISKKQIIIIHTDIPSLTRARNMGLRYVKNDIVLFCDDDILINKDTIAQLYQNMNRGDVVLVSGITKQDNFLYSSKTESKIDFICSTMKSICSTLIGLKKFWRTDGYVVRGSMRGRYSSHITKLSRTEWAMGYFFCIKKSFCSSNNIWFDENLIGYAYAEDLDFSIRYCEVACKKKKKTLVDPFLYVEHLASREWRTPNRSATFFNVINRRYLSYKIFPKHFWYRWFLDWSDLCWEKFGCKTPDEKKNWHDARNKCRQYKELIKKGNLNDVYE